MSKIVVSVESTADLSEQKAAEYGIRVVNMEYSVDGSVHRMGDGAYTMHEFYDKMRAGAVTKTAQVNEYEAERHLREVLNGGADVIHLAFSSSLSGTYNAFMAAKAKVEADFPNQKVAVVDSLSACSGQGFYAVGVAEYARTHGFEETLAYAESLRHRVIHLFVVDDLKYLARGGRISKATALLGNAIHMKPVMHMDKQGQLVPYKKVLSRKKSVLELASLTAAKYDGSIERIFIAHADCEDEAKNLANHIKNALQVSPELFDLGMVIGSHSGPGTLAVFFAGEARE